MTLTDDDDDDSDWLNIIASGLVAWLLGIIGPKPRGGFGSWEGVAAVVSSTIYVKRLW